MKYTLEKKSVTDVRDFNRPRSWYEFGELSDDVTNVYAELLLQFNPDIPMSKKNYLSDRIVCGNVWDMPSLHLIHNSGEPRYSITTPRDRDSRSSDNECLFVDALGTIYLGVFDDVHEDEYYKVVF